MHKLQNITIQNSSPVILGYETKNTSSNAADVGRDYAEKLRNLYLKGATYKDIAHIQLPDYLHLQREELDLNTIDKSYLYTIASKLEKNQVSEVVSGSDHLFFVKCLDRTKLGYLEYEDVKELVKSTCIDEQYNTLIQNLANTADVKINKKALNKIGSVR